jgi:O-methyltransferase involved in polyketide biosynthesis
VWFNIEMPDVVHLRQMLIPDLDRETTIARSVFDFTWMDDLAPQIKDRPMIIMAAGVLFYFKGSEVELLIKKLADAYPSAHFVFDSVPWFTLWSQNREVKKGRIPSLEIWRWHLKKTSELRKWVPGIRVMDEYSIFDRVRIREGWSRKMKIGIQVANFLRLYNMNHVQFG